MVAGHLAVPHAAFAHLPHLGDLAGVLVDLQAHVRTTLQLAGEALGLLVGVLLAVGAELHEQPRVALGQ